MRPASRTRVALAAGAVPALVLGLSACGPADTKPVAAQSAAQASAFTDQWNQKTLVPAMRAAIEKQTSVHVSMRTAAGSRVPMSAEGDLALHGKDHPDLVLTMDRTPMGGSAEVRVVRDVLYVSVPPMTPQGKFLELRPGDKSSPLGQLMGQLRDVGPNDPFAALESGLEKVTYVGQDTVQGEQLGHYRLTVDPRTLAKEHGMPHPDGMSYGGGPGSPGDIPRTATFDVWLDGNALVHRVRFDKPHQGSLVVDLTSWGKQVTVQAPPRQDIVKSTGRVPGMPGYSGS